tara:strand:+ start:276 stop:479 length:204 start_codon:yes stop_codon:yes gene_type:complete
MEVDKIRLNAVLTLKQRWRNTFRKQAGSGNLLLSTKRMFFPFAHSSFADVGRIDFDSPWLQAMMLVS